MEYDEEYDDEGPNYAQQGGPRADYAESRHDRGNDRGHGEDSSSTKDLLLAWRDKLPVYGNRLADYAFLFMHFLIIIPAVTILILTIQYFRSASASGGPHPILSTSLVAVSVVVSHNARVYTSNTKLTCIPSGLHDEFLLVGRLDRLV